MKSHLSVLRMLPRCALLVLVAFVAGCGEATDPRIADLRAKFLVTEAPDNPLSITDVSELMVEGAESKASSEGIETLHRQTPVRRRNRVKWRW